MPTPAKPADRRLHRGNASRNLALVPTQLRSSPPAPKGLLKQTQQDWDDYWASDVAKIAAAIDVPAVELYFATLDDWRRCRNAVKRTPLVNGSMGQPRANPLGDRADRLASLLPRLAAEIGMSPKARVALAINVGAAAKTIEDLNREVEADDDDDWGGTQVVKPVAPQA